MKFIVKLLLLIIIVIISILIIYIITKSNNNSEQQSVSPTYPIITIGPNELGFCHSSTRNGVDSPMNFYHIALMNNSMTNADNVDTLKMSGVTYKWIHDTNNPLTLERQLNKKKYNSQVLNAYGEVPGKAGFYYVNKIVPSYDPNHPYLSKDVMMDIKPFTLTKYSQQCKI